jgi:Amidohydrolase
MIDGRPLVDVHLHPVRLPTLKRAWHDCPKATGIQPVEDLLPLAARDPDRIKIIANVNPHLRGWWYDAAAFMALSHDRVWIELSGLPPSRLKTYYAKHNWNRLTRRMIFGTDWPGVPGIAANARAVAELCPDPETAGLVLAGNACRVYNLKLPEQGDSRD